MLAIVDRLAKSDPSNAGWRRDSAVSNDKVGQALFDLGRMQEATISFDAAIQTGGKPVDIAEFYWRRALSKLYANDPVAASNDAAIALEQQPDYPYYAIWLHIARTRAGQNDADDFAANAMRIDHGKWPWAVVALFLGAMSADEVQAAAASEGVQSERIGQSCEANFFIAIYLIEKGAPTKARPLLRSAAEQCPHNFVQSFLAPVELQRLGNLAGAGPN
jgi:lipoprotein NlpI